MRLRGAVRVVFDIDGTLTRSMDVDAAAYVRAFREVHGVDASGWARGAHPTDQGIALELLRRAFGRPPLPAEIAALRNRFLELLAASLPRGPELQMPGAGALLRRLRADGHAVALATGSWRASAELKLRAAALPVADLPLVTSDEHVEREAILRDAVARLGGKAVYVGDAAWDARAAAAVGIPFVGVGAAAFARLRDLRDPEEAVRVLRAAVAEPAAPARAAGRPPPVPGAALRSPPAAAPRPPAARPPATPRSPAPAPRPPASDFDDDATMVDPVAFTPEPSAPAWPSTTRAAPPAPASPSTAPAAPRPPAVPPPAAAPAPAAPAPTPEGLVWVDGDPFAWEPTPPPAAALPLPPPRGAPPEPPPAPPVDRAAPPDDGPIPEAREWQPTEPMPGPPPVVGPLPPPVASVLPRAAARPSPSVPRPVGAPPLVGAPPRGQVAPASPPRRRLPSAWMVLAAAGVLVLVVAVLVVARLRRGPAEAAAAPPVAGETADPRPVPVAVKPLPTPRVKIPAIPPRLAPRFDGGLLAGPTEPGGGPAPVPRGKAGPDLDVAPEERRRVALQLLGTFPARLAGLRAQLADPATPPEEQEALRKGLADLEAQRAEIERWAREQGLTADDVEGAGREPGGGAP
jgi:beta-phosphoglucomutase-like phosphatase (HAD superfamily)